MKPLRSQITWRANDRGFTPVPCRSPEETSISFWYGFLTPCRQVEFTEVFSCHTGWKSDSRVHIANMSITNKNFPIYLSELCSDLKCSSGQEWIVQGFNFPHIFTDFLHDRHLCNFPSFVSEQLSLRSALSWWSTHCQLNYLHVDGISD